MGELTRRHFIGASAIAGAAAVWALRPDSDEDPQRKDRSDTTSTPAPPTSPPDPHTPQTFGPELEAVRHALLAALPFLILPRATIDGFLAALGGAKLVPKRPKDALERFLLSTDFFAHGADEERPLHYVQLYAPYRGPCYNPMEPAV